MIRFIGIILSMFLTASFIFPQETKPFRDALIYSSPEEAWKIWRPVMGEDVKTLLGIESGGIRILDLTGDTYEAWNTQKAVFLRKPVHKPPYYFQVTIDDMNPPEKYGQAGIVAWRDADNCIRTTIGFNPAGMECLGEFGGKPKSRGVPGLYPVKNPQKTALRMEVLERSIRGYISHDGIRWFGSGGFTLPGENKSEQYLEGIGILGVAGGKTGLPIFSNWIEGTLAVYKDDEFEGVKLGDQWMTGQPNGGWGSDKTKIYLENGNLYFHPFPGSDIYFANENYPYISMPAPVSDSWTLEARISEFRGKAHGRWNKAGILFWQDIDHFITLSLVADEYDDIMYIEILSPGDNNPGSVLKTERHRVCENTEIAFRLARKDLSHYEGYAAFGSGDPVHLASFENPLYEPQIRLFATGDVMMQYPDDHDFYAAFDYIKIIKEE
ncbi:hypothetical protein JW926_11400 [Candidatus Sumerlaeota bacterium]|nr:hypothetical protein [Candidatus Sumerlaeota bacterium]